MEEEKATPYPLWTEDIFDVVCESTTDYGKPIVYQGTTITNALKDYYTFSTNREKIEVLKWIVAQPYFTELRRLSTAENKIYTLYTNQYNEILKTGETPNNLQIAQKFVANGYDVFLLANPHNTKSADFIIRQKNKLFYVEGKTSSGGSALSVRLREGAQQSEIIAVNFSNYPKFHELLTFIKRAFEGNSTLRAIVLFKKARMITISCKLLKAPNGENIFYKVWNLKK